MTPAEIEAIEGPIAELHQKRMTSSIDASLRALEGTIPVGRLEQVLHLSQGYLARARSKGEPSFALTALLALLAKDPRKVAALSELLPPVDA
jgi:hypothetical protein